MRDGRFVPMTAMNRTLTGSRNRRMIARRVADFLEYLLMLVVLLECNSLYCFARETAGHVEMNPLFYRLALLLAAAALALRLWLNPKKLRSALPNGLALLALIAYAAAFFVLNVWPEEAWRHEIYILNFLLFLPLMAALFKVKQREGRGIDLIFKYSDIVCALAAMSLAVYLASVLRPDSVPADLIYCRWFNRNETITELNLLDVSQLYSVAQWQMFGIPLLKNFGFFTEPLMFALPLLIALFTELFLRDRASRWRVLRWALLTVTLATVHSTIGLMLAAAAWGLKVISAGLERRKRWLVIPILVLAIAVAGVFFLEKGRTTYQSTAISGSSMSDHLDDYSASLKAFATEPLLGVGFHKEEAIFSFMQPYRLGNPGLSNSLGVILAEGGLVFGVLCLAPFFIWLMYLFRRRDWRVACWGLGALGVMAGIIFKYHLVLMTMIAFGYSLTDVRRGKRFMRLALVDTAEQRAEEALKPGKGKKRGKRLPIPVAYALAAAAFAALVLFGAPVWKALHTFMRSHQFSMGQVPLRSFCFVVALLLNGVALRGALRGKTPWARVALLLAWDAVYLLVYPALFSWANTLLPLLGLWGELRECLLLLALWLIPAALLLLARPAKRLTRRHAILTGAAAAVIAAIVLGSNLYIDRRAKAEQALLPELEAVVEASQGKVFVNDLPLLWHRQVKGVGLPATWDSGYEVYENVSVVFGEKKECRDLMESGFQVARLGDGHLLYTNDDAVVDALTARGEQFYRYYPFGREVDLKWLAELNYLTLTDDGAAVVDGPIESLAAGPYDTIFPGEYSAVFALHIEPGQLADWPADRQVCCISLTWNSGMAVLTEQTVTPDAFDANGDAAVSVSFAAGTIIDNVEYHLIGEADVRIEVQSIDIRRTPNYVTVSEYNSHRDVIHEAYYNTDGTPYLQGGLFAAVDRGFDMADRVTMLRYLGANGDPVLVGSGYAEIRYTYNNKGNVESEAFYGTDGRPIMLADGFSSDRLEYDAYGNLAVVRYYDTDGNPVMRDGGYAVVLREYDDSRNVIREEYLDAEGNPIAPDAE